MTAAAACALLAALALPMLCALAFAADGLQPWNSTVPALTLPDAHGAPHRLDEYRGRAVLVNFWATWCEPCREEMPALQRLQAGFGAERMTVLTVDVGDSGQKAAAFFSQAGLNLPLLFDKDSSVSQAWKVRFLPATFIIDARGHARYRSVGELDWDNPEYIQAVRRMLPTGLPPQP